jgi:hypothetical protein
MMHFGLGLGNEQITQLALHTSRDPVFFKLAIAGVRLA